jgi:hypothetical protein
VHVEQHRPRHVLLDDEVAHVRREHRGALVLPLVVGRRLKLLEDGAQLVLGREHPDPVPLVRKPGLEDEPLALGFVQVRTQRRVEVVQVVHEELVELVRELDVEDPAAREGERALYPAVPTLGEELCARVVEEVLADERLAVHVGGDEEARVVPRLVEGHEVVVGPGVSV